MACKPCPFCGTAQPDNPELSTIPKYSYDADNDKISCIYRKAVRCTRCHARGPEAADETIALLAWDENQVDGARREMEALDVRHAEEIVALLEKIEQLEEQILELSQKLAEHALEPEPEDGSGSLRG